MVGEWSPDGSEFKALTRGVLDYGQFYSARTIADASNTGRRILYGNMRTDVTQGPFGARTHNNCFGVAVFSWKPIVCQDRLGTDTREAERNGGSAGVNTSACEATPWSSSTETCPVWFFFALPRELSLGDDDRLLVKPPKELEQLRVTGSAVTKTVSALRCGQRMALGFSGLLAEVALTLRWPAAAAATLGWRQAGIYILDGGVSVGYEPTAEKLVLNATNSSAPPAHWLDGIPSRFQAAPSAVNVSAVNHSVSFRVYLDKIIVEVFEERGRAAITQVTAPIEAGASAEVGIFLECDGDGGGSSSSSSSTEEEEVGVSPSFEAKAWQLRPAPVRNQPTNGVAN